MKKNYGYKNIPFLSILLMLVIGSAAWSGTGTTDAIYTTADTIPKEKKVRDWEDILSELEKSKADIEKTLKEIDFSALEKELKKPLPPIPPVPPIEPEKIKAEVEKAMKEIDAAKMKSEAEASLAKVNWEKISKEVEATIAQIDWNKVSKEVEALREKEMPKIEAELKKLKPEIEASIEKAKTSIEKARNEIEAYKSFTESLEKDGLINKKESYTIEHKDGKLIINGKTQPAGIYNKYRSFLDKHPCLLIKKDKEGLNIN